MTLQWIIVLSRYTLDNKFNTKVWDFCYLLEANTIPPEKLGVLGRSFPHFGLLGHGAVVDVIWHFQFYILKCLQFEM